MLRVRSLYLGGVEALAISTFAWLTGKRVSATVSCKKLMLWEKRKTYLTQLIKEDAITPATKVVGFLA